MKDGHVKNAAQDGDAKVFIFSISIVRRLVF